MKTCCTGVVGSGRWSVASLAVVQKCGDVTITVNNIIPDPASGTGDFLRAAESTLPPSELARLAQAGPPELDWIKFL
jgi:hypothetical protein